MHPNPANLHKARWEGLGLSRSAKGGAFAVALLVLLAGSGWAMRMAIALMGALVVRCHLEQAEARPHCPHLLN